MGCAEVGFLDREKLKKAETKEQKVDYSFQLLFLVRQEPGDRKIGKQLIGYIMLFQVTCFV
jgi:hypothetical protein